MRDILLQRIDRKRTLKPLPLRRGQIYKTPSVIGGSAAVEREGEGDDDGEVKEKDDDENLLCPYDSDVEVSSTSDVKSSSSKQAVGYDSGSDCDSDGDSIFPRQAQEIPLDDKKRVDLEPLTTEVQTQLKMPKIFYCSRTHSQLAQFIGEVKKATGGSSSTLRCITLGSRSNMCINPSVRKLSSDAVISEKCLDMQKSTTERKSSATLNSSSKVSSDGGDKKRQRLMKPSEKGTEDKKISKKCEYHSASAEQHFAEHALSTVRDIEDLVLLAEEVHACPYYAARKALAQAQVVCLPYNLILSQQSRAALGISLEENVVIFDEAHNIVEAANMVHSAEISQTQLQMTLLALKTYLHRFRNVLNGKNFYYLNLLITIAKSFLKLLASVAKGTVDVKEPQSSRTTRPVSSVYTVNDFVFLSAIDNVNLRKVVRYTEVTHLVRKVGGHVDNAIHQAKELLKVKEISSSSQCSGAKKKPTSQPLPGASSGGVLDPRLLSLSTNALRVFFGLLTALQNAEADGRIFVAPSSNYSASAAPSTQQHHQHQPLSIQYVMLNPSNHFADIVQESRSVLFLGGTLQPFDYIHSSLFPQCTQSSRGKSEDFKNSTRNNCDSSRQVISRKAPAIDSRGTAKLVDTFSCSHIIPSSHITTYAVRAGPSNMLLDFRHGNRDCEPLQRELFWSVQQVCRAVPHGVVLFFTSYAYMESVVTAWKKLLLTPHLGAIKHICVERRKVGGGNPSSSSSGSSNGSQGAMKQTSKASNGDADAWDKYCSCIRDSTNGTSTKGAVLLSVMGGKLSEGINFSDDLARAVIIVGMPYPDLSDPVLKEKLSFAERVKTGSSRHIYEGMCMKSVNQSIGRAIRHIGDYAAVVLLDNRYTQPRIHSQLPTWILKSVNGNNMGDSDKDSDGIFHTYTPFQHTITGIESFFAKK